MLERFDSGAALSDHHAASNFSLPPSEGHLEMVFYARTCTSRQGRRGADGSGGSSLFNGVKVVGLVFAVKAAAAAALSDSILRSWRR